MILCLQLLGCQWLQKDGPLTGNYYKNINQTLDSVRIKYNHDSAKFIYEINKLADGKPISDDEKYAICRAKFRLYTNSFNNSDKALLYVDTLLQLSKLHGITDRVNKEFEAFNSRANILYKTDRFDEAFKNYGKAQLIADTTKTPHIKSRFFHTLAMACYSGEDYLQAARLFKSAYKAIEHDSNIQTNRRHAYVQEVLDNTGLSYYKCGMFDSAMFYYRSARNKVIEWGSEKNNTDSIGLVIDRSIIEGNLGALFAETGKLDSAEHYFKSSIQLNHDYMLRDKEFNEIKLSALLIKMGRTKEAFSILENTRQLKSLESSNNRHGDSLELVNRLAEVMYQYYESIGDYKSAMKEMETHHLLEESKWKQNAKLKLHTVENGLEHALNEVQIDELQQNKKIQNLQIIILVLVGVLGFGISYSLNKRKKRKIKQLVDAHDEVVTQSSAKEQELIQKNKRDRDNYLSLLENTDACLWSIDKDLNLLAFNKMYRKHMAALTDISPAVGQKDLILNLPKSFSEKVIEGYKVAMGGVTTQLLDKGFEENGEQTDIAMVFIPFFDAQGNVVSVSCSRRDISQFTKLKQSLEQNNEQFKNIAWLQSHKLRGPLSTAMGIVQLLSEPQALIIEKNWDELITGLKLKLTELDAIIHEIVGQTYTSKHDL